MSCSCSNVLRSTSYSMRGLTKNHNHSEVPLCCLPLKGRIWKAYKRANHPNEIGATLRKTTHTAVVQHKVFTWDFSHFLLGMTNLQIENKTNLHLHLSSSPFLHERKYRKGNALRFFFGILLRITCVVDVTKRVWSHSVQQHFFQHFFTFHIKFRWSKAAWQRRTRWVDQIDRLYSVEHPSMNSCLKHTFLVTVVTEDVTSTFVAKIEHNRNKPNTRPKKGGDATTSYNCLESKKKKGRKHMSHPAKLAFSIVILTSI